MRTFLCILFKLSEVYLFSHYSILIRCRMKTFLLGCIFKVLIIVISLTQNIHANEDLIMSIGIGDITTLAFKPDGSKIACAGYTCINLLDVKTGRIIYTINGEISSVAFSPDGSKLACGSFDKTIYLRDAYTGSLIHTFEGHSDYVRSVAYSPDGTKIASGCWDSTLKLWDVNTGSLIRTIKGHTGRVNSVAFSPDGSMLASGSDDKSIKLWDINTGILIRTFINKYNKINSIAFSPDGTKLASGTRYYGTDKNTVECWDVNTGSLICTLEGYYGGVYSVAFSPDGTKLATGSSDNYVKLWDLNTKTVIHNFKGHNYGVNIVTFSPDGSMIASGSNDNTIKLWDVNTGLIIPTFDWHSLAVYSVQFSPDDSLLASSSADRTIKLWDANSGVLIHTFKGHTDSIRSVAFSPDGSMLASGSFDSTIKFWDVKTGSIINTLKVNKTYSVAFSPDGSKLACGGADSQITLLDVSTGSIIRTFKGHTNIIFSVAFSPDGSMLVSGSLDSTIKLWDVNTGSHIRTIKGYVNYYSVTFSPDGSKIASGSIFGTLKLWDVKTGLIIRVFGWDDTINVTFSPDGTKIATGNPDCIKLWDINTGFLIHTFSDPSNYIHSVDFSSDGSKLVSGGLLGSIKIWRVPQDVLGVIDLTYKVRKTDPDSDLDWSEWVPSSKADGYETFPGLGERYCCVQPVGIIQNTGNKTCNFKVRVSFLNSNTNKLIYNRLVNVDSTCLAVPDSLTYECMGDPNVKIRYCDVSLQNGDYTVSYLPFPGKDNLNGIPPKGYVQIQFPPFEPSEFVDQFGDIKVSLIAEPIDPETNESLGDEIHNNDTVNKILNIIKFDNPVLIYPPDSSKNIPVNMLLKWQGVEYADEYIIVISKNKNMTDSMVRILSDFSVNVNDLEPNTTYYWFVAAVYKGVSDNRQSSKWSFTTGDNTDITDIYQFVQNAFYNHTTNSFNISYNLLKPGKVTLDIYNSLGMKLTTLADEYQESGHQSKEYEFMLTSGIYFYRLITREKIMTGGFVKVD